MLPASTLKRHVALLDRMGFAREVDLQEEVLRGHISSAEVADRALRCTGCTNPDGCERFLDGLQGAAAQTPAYCLNSDLFEDLSNR